MSELEAVNLAEALAARLPPTLQGSTLDESTAQLAHRIRGRLAQVNQTHPGSVQKVTEKLHASGMSTLDDLRREDALSLLSAMDGTDLESYLGVAVWYPSERMPDKPFAAKN